MKIKGLIILTFLANIINAQFKTDVSPMINFQSANSTTLGTFGDVPVSLYTGTPNIGIPIHKLNERGVELDINLEYNPRGVRVDDVPGWVGSNWSLNAGGVITRSVRGTSYDELNFFHGKDINIKPITPAYAEWPVGVAGGPYKELYQRGYFYHTAKLNVNNWDSTTNLINLAHNSYVTYPNPDWRQENFRMDLEPDLFTFNFMGHTGHFFLGQDGQWKVFSNSNLKVVCNLDTDISYPTPKFQGNQLDSNIYTYPKVINKITLVDEKGNKYLFDQVELTFTNIFCDRPPLNNDARCISSAFYLTTVTDINENVLFKFEYEKGPWQGKFNMNYNVSLYTNAFDGAPNVSNTSIAEFSPNRDWHSAGFEAQGQLILPSYLKKIKTESGIEVNFISELVQNALKYTRGGNPLIDDRSETLYGSTYGGCTDWYFLLKDADLVTDSGASQSIYSVWDRLKNKKLTRIEIKDNSNNLINVNFSFIDASGVRLMLTGLDFNNSKKYKFEYNGPNLPGFLNLSVDHLGYYNALPFRFTLHFKDYNFWTTELNASRATNQNALAGSLRKITYPTGGYTEFEFEPHSYSKKLNDNNQLVSSNGIIGGLRIKKITNNFNNSVEVKEYQYTKSIKDNTSSGNLVYNPVYFKDSGIITHPVPGVRNGSPLYTRSLNSLTSMANFMGVQLEYTDVIEKTSGNGYTHYKFSNYEEFPDIDPVVLHPGALPFAPKTDRSYERGFIKEKMVYNESNILLQKSKYTYQAINSFQVNAVNLNFSYYIGCTGCMLLPYGRPDWFLGFCAAYRIPYSDKYLVEESEIIYNSDGTSMYSLKAKNYVRYPQSYLEPLVNNGSTFLKYDYMLSSEANLAEKTTYEYPFESSTIINNIMVNKNVVPIIGEKTEKIQGDPIDPISSEVLSEKKMDYQIIANGNITNIPVPKESFIRKGDNTFEKEFLYTNYDSKGNIVEYKKENGSPISIVWGYHNTKPIAILENVSYQNIPKQTIDNLLNLSNLDIDNGINGITENVLRNALNSLRISFPDAMIKTYTYDSLTGVTWYSDDKENSTYFEYDDMFRLKTIKDQNGFLLKENQYKYK
jgi:hypothetical protein